MTRFRFGHVLAGAMLAALAAGCSADSETASEPKDTQATVTGDADGLDGVQVDVRRDPG